MKNTDSNDKKETSYITLILYSFTPSDMNFQTFLLPKVILVKKNSQKIYLDHSYLKYTLEVRKSHNMLWFLVCRIAFTFIQKTGSSNHRSIMSAVWIASQPSLTTQIVESKVRPGYKCSITLIFWSASVEVKLLYLLLDSWSFFYVNFLNGL